MIVSQTLLVFLVLALRYVYVTLGTLRPPMVWSFRLALGPGREHVMLYPVLLLLLAPRHVGVFLDIHQVGDCLHFRLHLRIIPPLRNAVLLLAPPLPVAGLPACATVAIPEPYRSHPHFLLGMVYARLWSALPFLTALVRML